MLSPFAGASGGSSTRMLRRNSADSTNESASASTATAAPSTWTSPPAAGGPTTNDIERLTLSLALASTTSARGTTRMKNVDQATSKKTVNAPTTNAAASRCSIVSASSQ